MKWPSSAIKLENSESFGSGCNQANSVQQEGNSELEEPSGNENSKLFNFPKKFIISKKAYEFKRQFYPKISIMEWNDWKWQIKNRITDYEILASMIELSHEEKLVLNSLENRLPFSITPYYASLLSKHDVNQPLRKTVIPQYQELITAPEEVEDPLGEEGDSPVEGLVHRYPDRVLFLTTNFCSTYCRYCTRSRIVGKKQEASNLFKRWNDCLDYIEKHEEIRDVLLSGGDALTLSDFQLDWLLARLQRIEHVEIKRIGTKIPVVLPQRITPELIRILKKYPPVYMNIHFSHPDEITPETSEACTRLAEAGVILGSQTVLLKGVNDDALVMKKLMQQLLKNRVRPYYIYQCDLVPGTGHFRTPLDKGLEIMRSLRGFTSGLAVPYFVIDAPHGGGKIPIIPNYISEEKDGKVFMKNYLGNSYDYPKG